MAKIIILGAGGFAREVSDIIEAALALKAGKDQDTLWGFVVDSRYLQKEGLVLVAGKPVLGDFEWLAGQAETASKQTGLEETGLEESGMGKTAGGEATDPDKNRLKVICGVGSPALRQEFAQKVKQQEWHRAVHPFSAVSGWAEMGQGTVVAAGCVVGNQARLGQHVILNRLSSVGHDAVVGDFVTVSPGVNIAGNVTIESGCYIGIGSTIIEGITIGRGSTIAAGSVITKNIPPFSTVAGNPGRVIKTAQFEDTTS